MRIINKEKQKQYQREWYKRNRQKAIDEACARRLSKKQWLADYKSTLSCKKCGESRTPCLDFHHKNGEKDHDVAYMANAGYGIETMKKEIEKCIVLCANCHRIEHLGESDVNGLA